MKVKIKTFVDIVLKIIKKVVDKESLTNKVKNGMQQNEMSTLL